MVHNCSRRRNGSDEPHKWNSGVRSAIEAGMDSIEHGNYINEETIEMLAQSGVVWTPTLVTVRNLLGCGRYEDKVLLPIIKMGERNLRLAFEKKVNVALGSDAGAYMVSHGQAFTMNMRLFVKYWERQRK